MLILAGPKACILKMFEARATLSEQLESINAQTEVNYWNLDVHQGDKVSRQVQRFVEDTTTSEQDYSI